MLLCAIGARGQQRIGPDEIRVITRPYVPVQHVLHVQTSEVQVNVIVRDAHGKVVPGLKQQDFALFDQNKLQKISAFLELHADTPSTEAPAASAPNNAAQPAVVNLAAPPPARFLVLFFDDLNSESADLRRAQAAAERFVNEEMRATDRVAIFSNSGEGLEAFSEDKQKILAAIEKLHGRPRVPERGLQDCPTINTYEAYLITDKLDPDALAFRASQLSQCYNIPINGAREMTLALARTTWNVAEETAQNTLARMQAAIKALSTAPGQRTLLMASSGFLTQTLEYDQDLIVNQALHASVVIDALDAKGLYTDVEGRPAVSEINGPLAQPGSVAGQPPIYEQRMAAESGMAMTAALAELADSTGGRFFHNNNDLAGAYREMASAPALTYLLSFVPDANDGKYHKLKVKLASGMHYDVQSRNGYFSPPKNANAPSPVLTAEEKLDKELKASDAPDGVPLVVTASEGKISSGQPVLWVDVHVDTRPLHFQQEKDRHVEDLMFVSALFDSHGKMIEAKESDVLMALRDPSLAEISSTGLGARLYLEAPPGNYSLREVVCEQVDGKVAAVTRKVEIK